VGHRTIRTGVYTDLQTQMSSMPLFDVGCTHLLSLAVEYVCKHTALSVHNML